MFKVLSTRVSSGQPAPAYLELRGVGGVSVRYRINAVLDVAAQVEFESKR